MNDTDSDILDRMLTEHGTSGLAALIADLCEQRAAYGEREVAPLYRSAAEAFRAI